MAQRCAAILRNGDDASNELFRSRPEQLSIEDVEQLVCLITQQLPPILPEEQRGMLHRFAHQAVLIAIHGHPEHAEHAVIQSAYRMRGSYNAMAILLWEVKGYLPAEVLRQIFPEGESNPSGWQKMAEKLPWHSRSSTRRGGSP
jgi:hypothetical protein